MSFSAPVGAVTVLMTVYNGMPYLPGSVESVLVQEGEGARTPFVIVNNASADGGREWLNERAERLAAEAGPRAVRVVEVAEPARAGPGALPDELTEAPPWLSVYHLPRNVGRTAVLNFGLDRVRTEFTAIMDADDLAHPRKIERQAAFLRAHPAVDLLGSDVEYIDQNGALTGREHFAREHAGLCRRLPLYNQFAHSAVMFRTGAARTAGGYDPAFPYAQDLALWIAMLRRGCRAASLPEPLTRIRRHPGQATRDLRLMRVRAEDNHRLARAMLEIPGMPAAARQAALLRGAGALWSLGRRAEALRQFGRGLRADFLPCNDLLWERLFVECKRRLRPS